MNELIPIKEQNGKRAVSARDLHAFSESKKDCSIRIEDINFTNLEYKIEHKMVVFNPKDANNKEIDSMINFMNNRTLVILTTPNILIFENNIYIVKNGDLINSSLMDILNIICSEIKDSIDFNRIIHKLYMMFDNSLLFKLYDLSYCDIFYAEIRKNKINNGLKMYTYIIEDKSNRMYKIGKSCKPKKRLTQLKVSNPNINILLCIDGDYEKKLHRTYNNKRFAGEWFALNSNDIKNIKNEFSNKLVDIK